MIKRLLLTGFILIRLSFAEAQDIDLFLEQVSENNPEIMAYQKLLEAKKIEARTGLSPSDPFVSFGYMPGNIEEIGTKKIWSVNQSFSFPTKYLLQNKISKSNIIIAEQEYNLGKLVILLNAKITMYDLVYNEKSLSVLLERQKDYNNLQAAWEIMVEHGEATILEYHKIKMELSSLNLRITMTEANINMLKKQLQFMTGNKTAVPELVDYPLSREFDSDALISEKILKHPSFIIPEKEFQISGEEFRLSKTGSLPEFQVGYNSEIIPGETYSGPVAGLSIPLWSNSNRIKAANARAGYSEAKRDAEINMLKTEVLNEISKMEAVKKSMNEVREILSTDDNKKYLDFALENGEISVTTYFSDLSVRYEIEDRYIELEYEYNRSLAMLLDHELLK